MLRLPNPGSDISGFLRIFQFLYEELKDYQPFSLDDMTHALIRNNLATSSGFMGDAALERSTRDDRSLDPLYNQSKAYSELYRMLGWIHPQENSKLTFSFTYLGAHAEEVRKNPKAFVEQCLLGFAVPNSLVESKGDHQQRTFACILLAAAELDGRISRDEIIVGPMSLKNDRDDAGFRAMLARIRRARKKNGLLDAELREVAEDRGITLTTMGNYTRLPMAVLNWTGWAKKERHRQFGKPTEYRVLTEKGHDAVRQIKSLEDLRKADLKPLDQICIASLSKIAFYQMLERSGFDVTSSSKETDKAYRLLIRRRILSKQSKIPGILFSPFQELEPQTVSGIFPSVGAFGTRRKADGETSPSVPRQDSTSVAAEVFVPVAPSEYKAASIAESRKGPTREGLSDTLMEIASTHNGDLEKAADHVVESYRLSKKEEFYPLIADLFCLLDFEAEVSRMGVNYQRADVLINQPPRSIPIEVKSPTEELHISVKAVRQAVENKIILIARTPEATTMDITTLAVGFYLPNARAEVEALVNDVKNAYGISVGVIDLHSLLLIVLAKLTRARNPNLQKIEKLFGIINVADL